MPKVMHSAAGYYVGTADENGFPYSRLSGYYYSRWEAASDCEGINVPDVTKEIQDELLKAKTLLKQKNPHRLMAKRVKFLETCLQQVQETNDYPTISWDYSA